MSLQSAGITNNYWWSFSYSDGSLYTANNHNCGGGTSTSGKGAVGQAHNSGSNWITHTTDWCTKTYDLMCIAKP